MRLLIIPFITFTSAAILLPSFSSAALSPEMKTKYANFNAEYDKIFKLSDKKTEFAQSFFTSVTKLKKIYSEFETLEKTVLTSEGNQMALDMEMLEPLVVLSQSLSQAVSQTPASSTTTLKEACNEALALNDLSASSDEIVYKKIKTKIKNLCK